jgi:hypothetical protein
MFPLYSLQLHRIECYCEMIMNGVQTDFTEGSNGLPEGTLPTFIWTLERLRKLVKILNQNSKKSELAQQRTRYRNVSATQFIIQLPSGSAVSSCIPKKSKVVPVLN